MFVTTKTNSLSLEGGFYLLENSGSWKITKHKELEPSVEITKGNLGDRIPKPGTVLALAVEDGSSNDF